MQPARIDWSVLHRGAAGSVNVAAMSKSVSIGENDRINIEYDLEVCTWARYFNTSEKNVKEAVAAVGDSAVKVRDHLHSSARSSPHSERPSA